MPGTSGIVAGAGLDKEAVAYRHHEKCLSCIHFYPPNSCERVSGNISSEAVCNQWEIKKRAEGRDGEFYKEEYDKSVPMQKADDSGAGFYKEAFNKSQKKR